MRDIHCHILPGVDDGSPDMAHSLAMLAAAKAAGVTSMVCTPHCRDPYFDYDRMVAAFDAFRSAASGFPMAMGFEVNHAKLMQLGVGEWGPRLGCRRMGQFLLELDTHCTANAMPEYERTIYQLQGMGWRVVIAHPERYDAIRRDPELARRLVELDCDLQASADFIQGGRLGNSGKTAKRLFQMGLYRFIASDAHRVEHYELLKKACQGYGVKPSHMH
ncbi:MAG: phosphoesterase [Coriobacteriaceae bacterium]|nr:phosphoesterase [Olsenella sp.]RRF88975.1 MAG: phosphoesterase [Coriobacteriaceae bacterium]